MTANRTGLSIRETLAPMAQPGFRRLFTAQMVSMIGSTISPVALSLGILLATGSGRDLGLVLAAYSAPLAVFLLIGGVWADRVSRLKLMQRCDQVRAFAQFGLGALLLSGTAELWSMMMLQAITGIATAFFSPASTGLTTAVVADKHLQQANALLRLCRNIAGVAGPLVAALLVTTVGAGWAMMLDGLTFVGSAVFLARIKLPDAAEAQSQRRGFRREVSEGWAEIRQRPWISVSILNFMAYNFLFAMILVLGPVLLLRRPDGVLWWGGVIAVFSVGQIAGNTAALWFQPVRPMLASRLVELLGVPLFLGLAAAAPVPALLLLAALAGFSTSFPDALWFTALQRNVPPEKISRVSSFDWLGSLLLRPIGLASAALLADLLGATATLIGAGLILGAIRAASLLLRDMRTLRSG